MSGIQELGDNCRPLVAAPDQSPAAAGGATAVAVGSPMMVPGGPCTMSQSTLRMLGLQSCTLCGQPRDSHTEFDPGIYGLGQDGMVYGAPVLQQPPPPQPMMGPQAGGGIQELAPMGGSPHGAASPGGGPGFTQVPVSPPAATQGQPARSNGAQEQGMSTVEIVAVGIGWLVTLGLWFHLWVMIPVCESKKNARENSSFCNSYYGSWQDNTYRGPQYAYSAGVWVVFAFLCIFYVVHAVVSPTRRYLSNVLPNGIEEYVSRLIRVRPKLVWSIQCYHYETEYYTDDKGNRQSRQKRVDTHSATTEFRYDQWRDVSGAIVGPVMEPVRRLRSYKRYIFADAYTKAVYDAEFASWVAANDVDTHKTVDSFLAVENFESFTLTYPKGDKPFGFDLLSYVVAVFFVCSMPYRMYFYARTTPVDFYCVKEVRRSR